MEKEMADSYRVRSLKKPAQWTVEVPGSKSITNRALLLSALCKGHVYLHGVLFSDDSRHFLSSLQSLGYDVRIDEGQHTVELEGCGGILPVQAGSIHVGSAGTAARFLTAMLGVSEGTFVINASEQMQKRPMQPLFEALISLGASAEWLGEAWHLPVRITGAGAQIRSLEQEAVLNLDISTSTQFLSAFLLIAPMFPHGIRIHITSEKKDGSYIRITRKMMQEFGVEAGFDGCDYTVAPFDGYQKTEYQIEPDVSGACYFYAAAAMSGGSAKVKHVHWDSMQGDMKFLKLLEQMGCSLTEEADGIRLTGPVDGLKGLEVNMNDFSDQALTLAAIAPYASSSVKITHVGHIRGQECDRLHAIVTNLRNAGITCEEGDDWVQD
jgi:3-phosphoshikimate 1-carboxyvinyltransferase